MFSAAIEKALQVSLLAHEGQLRKSSQIPYVSHPVHVALILARIGADEETIQAALLHDVVEDCEGWTLERVEKHFGPEVRAIVDDVTEQKGLPWEERKQGQIDHVAHMQERGLLVKAADKLHNLSSLVAALREAEHTGEIWQHFSRGPEQTIANAERLVAALTERLPVFARPLAEALEGVLEELRRSAH